MDDQFESTADAPLVDDCALLGTLLDDCLRGDVGEELYQKLERIRALAQCAAQLAQKHDEGASRLLSQRMAQELTSMSLDEAMPLARALGHYLSLTSIAELHHRVRQERSMEHNARGMDATLERLIAEGMDPDEVYREFTTQFVEIVLTAHPTQVNRRTIQYKHAKIAALLQQHDRPDLTSEEREHVMADLMREISALWQTDELRRQRPTPVDEARGGLHVVEQSLWHAVPAFLRRMSGALKKHTGRELPLNATPIKFGSWMGGDRDGNPNVTAETTRDVCVLARLEAVNAYFLAVEGLMFELSMWRCSPELAALAERLAATQSTDRTRVAEERKRRNYADFWTPIGVNEPFRVVLSHLRDRLWQTREALHQCLINPSLNVKRTLEEGGCVLSADELFAPLRLMYDSLVSTGDESTANAHLLDVLRQVQCFGMSLVRLDIRQESTRHAEVVDAITQHLGLGSFLEWEEPKRLAFLLEELGGRRPLFPPGMDMSGDVREVVATFRTLAELPSDSLGAYIISMARTASDVLSVVLLQRECGIRDYLRVVPLFETLDDLGRAPATLRTLCESEWYLRHIKGVQECMIGYSDSGKDAGRVAAAWSLFETQEKLVEVADQYGVRLILFHGRGGSVGRGGGPTHMAIRSQPPGTIKGCLRVTIQGETIEQQFGEKEVAFRTLDLYTSAVLEACLDPPSMPKQEWRDMMDRLSRKSCEVYRSYVFQNPLFIEYFNAATPVGELGRLNIGSRPASRKQARGVEGLRAIPWVFAWTQTRFHLPVWLGIGDALQEVIDNGQLPLLQDMYDNWPFFKSLVDLVEMVMAKADPRVTRMYDARLARPELQALGDELRAKFDSTQRMLMSVAQEAALLEGRGVHASGDLNEKLRLRAPYVAPLNVLQVLALHRLREFVAAGASGASPQARYASTFLEYTPDDEETRALLRRDPAKDVHPFQAAMDDCLMITIKGIAAGMQNTG